VLLLFDPLLLHISVAGKNVLESTAALAAAVPLNELNVVLPYNLKCNLGKAVLQLKRVLHSMTSLHAVLCPCCWPLEQQHCNLNHCSNQPTG
jgi:hypothetical protein